MKLSDALFRANCQKNHRKERDQPSHSKFMGGMVVENQLSEKSTLGPEKNRKRDIRDWQREDRGFRNPHNIPTGEATFPRRGDIPVTNGDCDG